MVIDTAQTWPEANYPKRYWHYRNLGSLTQQQFFPAATVDSA